MVHPAKFEIVGRPQLQAMEVIEGPVLQKRPTVLVAPTWGGSALGEQLSSLSTNPEIVKHLISQGARVIFRPHPFCKNTPAGAATIKKVQNLLAADNAANGAGHIYGAAAETNITVNEAANLSNMIVSDLSGIMSDWLFSLKPYLLVSMDQSAEAFAERYPMGRAGVVVDGREPKDFAEAITRLIASDTQEAYEARKKMREYYLAGANSEDRTALFNSVVKKLIA
jgi:CDP-glycerol glycerophosphotransferase (TagB/SpsB family)